MKINEDFAYILSVCLIFWTFFDVLRGRKEKFRNIYGVQKTNPDVTNTQKELVLISKLDACRQIISIVGALIAIFLYGWSYIEFSELILCLSNGLATFASVYFEVLDCRTENTCMSFMLLFSITYLFFVFFESYSGVVTRNDGYIILLLGFQFLILFSYAGFKRDIKRLRKYHDFLSGSFVEPLLGEDVEQDGSKQKLPLSQQYNSGLVYIALFFWIEPLLKTGAKRPLERNDFFSLRSSENVNHISVNVKKTFDSVIRERKLDDFLGLKEETKKQNYLFLVTVLWRARILNAFFFCLFLMLCYDVLDFMPPYVLNVLLKYMSDPSETKTFGVEWVLALLLGSVIQAIVNSQLAQTSSTVAMRVSSAFQSLIYQKSLRLSAAAKEELTVGQIMNLMTTDVRKVHRGIFQITSGVSCFYCLSLATYFLYQQIGYATFIAELVIVLTLPLTSYISKQIDIIQEETMHARDKRVKLTTETLAAIKALKLYAWDKAFNKKIDKLREQEMYHLWRGLRWEIFSYFVWPSNKIIMTLAAFTTFTLVQGKVLDAALTFTTLSLLNLLSFPLGGIPQVIMTLVETRVSLRRISAFLLAPEIDEKASLIENDISNEDEIAIKVCVKKSYWDDKMDKVALNNINLTIKQNEMCFVTGVVGSGKTALLNLLLNELRVVEENSILQVNGSVAYAGQVPWIQNATVKDNILFGKPYDKDWYEVVVHACALIDDFRELQYGDKTEIGERGINLSGGQKARISLARAVYSRHDILLLENCFEAVDENVGEHIWIHCFKNLLYGKKTVLCVSHALKRLKHVDRVIFLANSTVAADGSFSEITRLELPEFEGLINALEKQQQKVTQNETKDEVSIEKVKMDPGTIFPEKKTKEVANELTGEEDKKTGGIAFAVYKAYINAAGGLKMVFLVVFVFTVRNLLQFVKTRWLAYASVHFETPAASARTVDYDLETVTADEFLIVLAGLAFTNIIFIAFSAAVIFFAGYEASLKLHSETLKKLLKAPLSFFNTNPSGRILNRFSKDLNDIDEELPWTFIFLVYNVFAMFAVVLSIAYVTPSFLFFMPFAFIIYHYFQKLYLKSAREVQRLEAVIKSPMYSLFSETLVGTSTVRAFDAQTTFIERNLSQINEILQAWYVRISLNNWLATRFELTGVLLRTMAGILIVMYRDSMDPGLAGLALTYSFRLTNTLKWVVRSLAYLETELVSVERLTNYLMLPSEGLPSEQNKLVNWPTQGRITFKDVEARYRPGLPLVLKGISFCIAGGEKVGVVGRTGAGKSSLFLVLLRIVEVSSGKISVDGVNTKTISLEQLRSRISIIPQDPIMFSGSVRNNLDPTEIFKDEDLIEALKACQLHDHLCSTAKSENMNTDDIKAKKYPELEVEVKQGGSNFSFGQRQLLCIARSILRRCKILLLDEATSGIDLSTDAVIQDTIRNEFRECTVVTIAHRIETILGGDKVLVLDDGKVVEFDEPTVLLNKKDSTFKGLVDKMSGI